MPIPIENIEQAIQGHEVVSSTYGAADGLLTTEGADYRKIPKDTYELLNHITHQAVKIAKRDAYDIRLDHMTSVGDSGYIGFDKALSGGRVEFMALAGGGGRVEIESDWDITLRFTNRVTLYGSLRTFPQGSNYYLYADGFVEWSEAALKENIRPLGTSHLLDVEPKLFEEKGVTRSGLVVEDVAPKIPEAVIDDHGHKGISWGAIISHILYVLRDFNARLKALEGVK